MICQNCKIREKKEHKNARWCKECAESFKKRPKGTLSKAQIKTAKSLIGKMSRKDIAKKIGCSLSNLTRSLPGVRIAYYNRYYANPKLVRLVCSYYSANGMKKTRKKFPNVNIRSVIERYETTPRQKRWEDEQIISLAKMAGIISMEDQALFFSRPNANAGSISSVWGKRFRIGGSCVNGLSWVIAREYVTRACPVMETDFWMSRHPKRKDIQKRRLVLWVDLHKYLKKDVPSHLREMIKVMADFQRWLHGRYVRKNIEKMKGKVNGKKRDSEK